MGRGRLADFRQRRPKQEPGSFVDRLPRAALCERRTVAAPLPVPFHMASSPHNVAERRPCCSDYPFPPELDNGTSPRTVMYAQRDRGMSRLRTPSIPLSSRAIGLQSPSPGRPIR